jgi:hypothetical protein
MRNSRFVLNGLTFSLAAAWALAGAVRQLPAAEPAMLGMLQVAFQGRTVEGSPLDWNRDEVHLLGRDGRLWQFAPEEATRFKRTAAQFHAYSPSELRAALLKELGEGYDVSGTTHYLVAHPRGQRDKWADRFEELYRSFVHFWSVRGLQPAAPRFPLIGLVAANRGEFARLAAAQGSRVSAGVEGYYDTQSNRITLYDMGGRADSANWRTNAAVLIHEATHQTAFNTGVHSRYCLPPKWLAEGLAMLFEAPGVHDCHRYPQAADRVNRDRLRAFRQAVAPHHTPKLLAAIVAGDDLFCASPGAAYAEAWALSFFLVETEPAKYARYLKQTASRPPFRRNTAAERTAGFTAVFGSDWRMLEARFLRFLATVK